MTPTETKIYFSQLRLTLYHCSWTYKWGVMIIILVMWFLQIETISAAYLLIPFPMGVSMFSMMVLKEALVIQILFLLWVHTYMLWEAVTSVNFVTSDRNLKRWQNSLWCQNPSQMHLITPMKMNLMKCSMECPSKHLMMIGHGKLLLSKRSGTIAKLLRIHTIVLHMKIQHCANWHVLSSLT